MNAPSRILFVHNSADIYGASRVLLRLIRGLDRSRFEPIAVLPEDGPLSAMLAASGVRILFHPSLSILDRSVVRIGGALRFALQFPASVLFLYQTIRKHRIALVHTNTGVMPSSALAATLSRIPHIWHIREWFGEFRQAWPLLSRYILALSSKVLCISRAVAEQFPPSSKLLTVYDGMDPHELSPADKRTRAEARSKFGLPNTAFVAGCVGRIKWMRKGQEHLIRAAGLLARDGIEVHLLIVGAPFKGNESHLTRLHDLAAELGISNRVIFAGEIQDPATAYAAMDVFVLPSEQPEPFGMVMLEAMAAGVPVVASRLGGPIEVVVDGETGVLFQPGKATELAHALATLKNSPELASKMGKAGRDRLITRFAPADTLKAISCVYANLVRCR